jgi:hypothetical protein
MKAASAKSQTVPIPPVDLRSSDAVNQFRRASRAISKRIQQSKNPRKASREWLVEVGILTPTGRLSKHYR